MPTRQNAKRVPAIITCASPTACSTDTLSPPFEDGSPLQFLYLNTQYTYTIPNFLSNLSNLSALLKNLFARRASKASYLRCCFLGPENGLSS